MKTLLRSVLAAACLGLLQAGALAQTWPTKPVRIIVPFGAGGTSDTLGRVVAEQLGETFKQQFIVENRPGAGGLTGSALVARAPPDGYTLLVSGVASHVVVPAINPSASYDPVKDFTHIALFGGPPSAFVVNPSVKAAYLEGVRGRGPRLRHADKLWLAGRRHARTSDGRGLCPEGRAEA